jgi:hypothetical protein
VSPTGKIWNKTLIFAECITNARTAYNEAVQALPYSAEFPQLMDVQTATMTRSNATMAVTCPSATTTRSNATMAVTLQTATTT